MFFIRQARLFMALIAVLFLLNIESAHANGGEGAAPPKSGPMYVDFKNIVIPVIQKNGKTGMIVLALMAEVQGQENYNKVTTAMPKLRDAFIRALYGNLDSERFKRADGTLDIDHIKERLMRVTEVVSKDEKEQPIKDLLFQNIGQQTY